MFIIGQYLFDKDDYVYLANTISSETLVWAKNGSEDNVVKFATRDAATTMCNNLHLLFGLNTLEVICTDN